MHNHTKQYNRHKVCPTTCEHCGMERSNECWNCPEFCPGERLNSVPFGAMLPLRLET